MAISKNTFLNRGPSNLLFFIDSKGKLKPRSPMSVNEEPTKTIVKYRDYLVVLFESVIEIFSV